MYKNKKEFLKKGTFFVSKQKRIKKQRHILSLYKNKKEFLKKGTFFVSKQKRIKKQRHIFCFETKKNKETKAFLNKGIFKQRHF